MLRFAAAALLLLPLTRAFELVGKVQWNSICPGFADIHGAKVVLDDGRWSANVRRDGNFSIPHVPQGSYVLSVLSHDFQFDQLRIDVSDAPTVHPHIAGTPFSPPSPVTLPYPVTLVARSRNIYFVERQGFNLIGMFKNPMMLIMVFTAAMVFAMPYLMANIDPETRNEIRDTQQKMLSAQTSLQNMDMGGLKNLLTPESDNSSHSSRPSPPQASASAKGKNKGKKR